MTGRPQPQSSTPTSKRLTLTAIVAAFTMLPLFVPAASALDVPEPIPVAETLPVPVPDPALAPLPVPVPLPLPVLVPIWVPTPVPSVALPFTNDVLASYQGQRSCDPAAKAGVEAYARMVLTTYGMGRSGGISRGCGLGSTSEHKEGRAFDYMLNSKLPAEKAAGDGLTQWLTGPDEQGVVGGNARRLGIMYVIWNRRFWSTYALDTGWRAYRGPNPHTDHIHTSFSWDGAQQRTSWWSGTAVEAEDVGPCRVYVGQPAPVYTRPRRVACPTGLPPAPLSSYRIVWPGQSNSAVRVAQTQLGLAADGVFGASTRARLMGWQRSTAVPVTGVLDKPTWALLAPAPIVAAPVAQPVDGAVAVVVPTTSLTRYQTAVLSRGSRGPGVKALQRALKVHADGIFGGATIAAVAAVQTRRGLPGTGLVDAATWAAVERLAHPLLPHRLTLLQRYSTGPPVLSLERALKIPADEYFGPATLSAVRAAQSKARLPQTGVVNSATWAAIEAQAYPLGAVRVSPQLLARTTGLSPYKATTLRQGASGLVVTALQSSLGVTADGTYEAATIAAVTAFQVARKLPATGVVDHRTWNAVESVAYPLLRFRGTTLRVGSKGAAVVALQKSLRQKPDGRFGVPLQKVVKRVQARDRIRATGTVTAPTWVGIEKRSFPLGVKRW